MQAALRKVLAALPAPLRAGARAAGTAIVVDPATWDRTAPPAPPHLDALRRAVVEERQVVLGYGGRGKPPSTRTVSPLGLVDKSGVWYLLAGTEDGVRTFRVGRVTSCTPTEVAAVRPEGFDLAVAWEDSAATVEARRAPVAVRALAEAGLVPRLRALLGTRLHAEPAGAGDRVEIEVVGPTAAFVAAELSRFGSRVEVTDPPEAREHLATLAAELRRIYGDAGAG